MRRWRDRVRHGAALVMIAGCAGAVTDDGGAAPAVTGNVVADAPVELPAGAVVTVQLEDQSLMDVAATVLGEDVITAAAELPTAYAVSYDPSAIDERMTYGLRARVEDGAGTLMFITTSHVPVLTHGAPEDDVDVPVEAIAP